MEVRDANQQECHIQCEEQEEEGDGTAQGTKDKDKGEDEPALRLCVSGLSSFTEQEQNGEKYKY